MKGLRALLSLLLICLTPCVSFPAESLQKLLSDLESWNKDEQVQAAVALGEMGPAAQIAVPALIRVIKTGRPELRVVSSIALLKIDPDMKDMVPMLLQALDKQGKGLEPHLPKEIGLQDDALRKWSALMRSKLDPKILPVLAEAIHSNDPDIRILGVLVLGGIAGQIPEAMPYILKAYEDPDKEVRGAVIGVLSRINPKQREVVPGILRGLKDREPEIRIHAAQALGSMGLVAKQAVPELARLLERGGPEEQIAAADALLKLDPTQSGKIIPRMAALLKNRSLESPVRLQAADLLAQAGPAAGEESDDLAELLEDPDPAVRGQAVRLLSGFGPSAVPVLLNSLQSAQSLRRSGAIQALMRMSPIPPELLPALTGCLKDKEPSVRYLAAEGLEELGMLAQAAIPDLVQALDDPEESIRTSAGDALLKMGEPAVAALAQAASDSKDPQLQARASILMKKAGDDQSP